jgi:Tol biopolymer transport system component
MTPDGKQTKELTVKAGTWENTKPAWSPDSQQIAFYRWTVQKNFTAPGAPAGLWIVNLADNKEQQLVDFTDWLPSDAPVWSPDGKLIAFDYGNKDDTNVWVAPVQGGKPMQISKLPGGEKYISWSPDSKAFVFTNLQQDVLTLYLAQPDQATPHPIFETNGNGFGDWSP